MILTSHLPKAKNTHRRKRVGRGIGSNRGTYSGSGNKGQHSRGSGKVPLTFTGGENSIIKSAPKLRGFKPIGIRPQTITLVTLNKNYADGETVNMKSLLGKGLLQQHNQKFKIVDSGELTKKLIFDPEVRLTKGAREKLDILES